MTDRFIDPHLGNCKNDSDSEGELSVALKALPVLQITVRHYTV